MAEKPLPSHDLHMKIRNAGQTGDTSVLIDALGGDGFEAPLAAQYLGELGATTAVPCLIALLESENPHTRASSAIALGQLRAVAAVPLLGDLWAHEDVPWVRAWAVAALAEIGGAESIDIFKAALEDADSRVRRAARTGLVGVGNDEALAALESAKGRQPWFRRTTYRKAIRQIRLKHR